MGHATGPVGLCLLAEPRPNAARTVSYPAYLREILEHAGLCYRSCSPEELAATLPELRILVTVGEETLDEPLLTQLQMWVENGGCWLAIGGVCGAANLFGVAVEAPSFGGFGGGVGTLGEGYLHPVADGEIDAADRKIIEHIHLPLHYFDGMPVQATTAQVLATLSNAHQQPTERVGVTQRTIGRGCALLMAIDLPGTIVRIQQGIGITRDGVAAPDGTAPVNDVVLKSGDGAVLDWIFDRQPVPGVPGLHAFLEPIADLWRELLLRAIFRLAQRAQVALPLLWLYPSNLSALAHLSHDSDMNVPTQAERMLEVVAEAEIPATWCVILPGYEASLIDRIRAGGHELAMHYDAMSDECPWDGDLFHEQWTALTAMFGNEQPVSNKNHYLRWEGDTELFEWCWTHGIQLDQSKGASKTGEAGFNFGTCHPYFPMNFQGEPIDVLEMTTPTQDLIVFAPPAILPPLLDGVLRSHGILHLLFHPSHIEKPGVADAILDAVKMAKAAGLEWWTAARINAWERARRQVRWRAYSQNDTQAEVTIKTSIDLPAATILWLAPAAADTGAANEEAEAREVVTRWGFPFWATVTDLTANRPLTVKNSEASEGAAVTP